MNLASRIGSGVLLRILLSAVLAGVALTLFLMHRATLVRPPEARQRSVRDIVADVDREVDTVLARFHVEHRWIRKVEIPIPNAEISRIERRVAIPPDLMAVQLNQALNSMARRYNGRAIASENLKENSVTIHIELEGYLVQTLILKPSTELRRDAGKVRSKKSITHALIL